MRMNPGPTRKPRYKRYCLTTGTRHTQQQVSVMLFRDGQRNIFPQVTATDDMVAQGRKQDLALKEKKQVAINATKYKTDSHFTLGDHVLVRNYQKTRKFDPTFLHHC